MTTKETMMLKWDKSSVTEAERVDAVKKAAPLVVKALTALGHTWTDRPMSVVAMEDHLDRLTKEAIEIGHRSGYGSVSSGYVEVFAHQGSDVPRKVSCVHFDICVGVGMGMMVAFPRKKAGRPAKRKGRAK